MQETPAVSAQNVTKTFGAGQGAVTALNDVSVNISQNEFFTLLGPSGCGKTTLLRLVAGFEHPTVGNILLEGEDISALPPYQRPVNTVFQSYALFPHMTVSQNIAFGLEAQGRPKNEVAQTVGAMLGLVHLEAMADRRTDQLSGGQQQRVALARALAPRPKVLLLDEPLSALDLKLRKQMQIELKQLQHETGITFIFVTHDQEEALTMSDRIAVMSEARINQIGTPQEIYEHPTNRFVADFIGETNFLKAELVETKGTDGQVRLRSGSVLSAALPEGSPPSGDINLVVRPESSRVSKEVDGAPLSGTLEEMVYFGTDTHFHVRLEDGDRIIARQQNTRGDTEQFATGERVGVYFLDNSLQVLRD